MSACKSIALLLCVVTAFDQSPAMSTSGSTHSSLNVSCVSHVTLPSPTHSHPPSYVYLSCQVVHSVGATLSIHWQGPNDRPVSEDDSKYERYNITTDNVTDIALDVWRLSYMDRGVYSVRIEKRNQGSTLTSRHSIQLDLLTSLNTSVEVTESSALISCEMSGYIYPDTAIQWFKDGRLLRADDRLSISFEQGISLTAQNGGFNNTYSRVAVLRIDRLSASDAGQYTCAVPSRVASATLQLDPTVYEPTTNTTTDPLWSLTALGLVLVLIATVLITLSALVWHSRKVPKDSVDISTSANVSYGSHVTKPDLMEDPLYESIRSGVHYDIARPPDDSMDYYVNEGLGP